MIILKSVKEIVFTRSHNAIHFVRMPPPPWWLIDKNSIFHFCSISSSLVHCISQKGTVSSYGSFVREWIICRRGLEKFDPLVTGRLCSHQRMYTPCLGVCRPALSVHHQIIDLFTLGYECNHYGEQLFLGC